MSLTLILFIGLVAGLLLLLGWALRSPQKQGKPTFDPGIFEESGRRHVTYFPQILRSMSREDREFLASRGGRPLDRRVQRERRRIALRYLSLLREDFRKLLRLARVIAVLSPEVAAGQEFERFRLNAEFALRYQVIRMKLHLGVASLPQLNGLTQLVSGLAVRIEMAMRELGERAALAAELASSLDRSGMGAA
jgi:hypothetical protein